MADFDKREKAEFHNCFLRRLPLRPRCGWLLQAENRCCLHLRCGKAPCRPFGKTVFLFLAPSIQENGWIYYAFCVISGRFRQKNVSWKITEIRRCFTISKCGGEAEVKAGCRWIRSVVMRLVEFVCCYCPYCAILWYSVAICMTFIECISTLGYCAQERHWPQRSQKDWYSRLNVQLHLGQSE